MWSEVAQTTSECGLSDELKYVFNASWWSCHLFFGSLWTDFATKCEQGLRLRGIAKKGTALYSVFSVWKKCFKFSGGCS